MEIQKLPKESYPHLLKQIKRLPKQMDIVGHMPSDEYTFLCIIGSRTQSTYGQKMCEQLISGLAGYPIVIVSGLALGMDSIAHEAALKTGLKTIAFPGSGLSENVLYPYSHKELAKRIVSAGGALVSSFPTTMASQNWMFPVRNRLMAGISHATLIVEARRGSGTLITATYAEEFNRDILAVPGPIDSELSYGPHMLIRRGATPITSSQDILEALGFTDTSRYDEDDERAMKLYGTPPKEKKVRTKSSTHSETKTIPFSPQPQKQSAINLDHIILSPEERSICTYIMNESLTATDLIEKTSLPISRFNITISELEIKGLIRQEGDRFRMKV